MNSPSVINNLFVDRRNELALDSIYSRFVRERREQLSFADLAYRSRKQVMHETMSGDINSLGHQLNRFSERSRYFRDFTLYSLISTLSEIIACFPVYRTYVTAGQPASEHDRRYIREAVASAKRRAPAVTSLVFDFIERLLLQETPLESPEASEERSRFVGKFQQATSPVVAKGIEDTAFYLYNRLLSLNEVGSNPTQFGLEPSQVHDWLVERQRHWPAALSATATHDTKRGEDVRARLNVLSELPGAWKEAVARWRTLNRRFKVEVKGTPAPDPNEEYFLYQTLVGAWPFDQSDAAHDQFRDRMIAYMRKAMRESKAHTTWLSPDEAYEKAVLRFVESILDRRRPNLFLQAFLPFQARIAELGIYNSLAQLVIKITAPGVPDFYQGTELWDLNLVDPDNRRPVDYEQRRAVLTGLQTCSTPESQCATELLEHRTDGRVKMFVTTRALAARREWRDIYEGGDYVPLQIAGGRRDCLFAFARVAAGSGTPRASGSLVTITCVPRLIGSLISDAATPPLGHLVWGDTQDRAASRPRRRPVMPPFSRRVHRRDGRAAVHRRGSDDRRSDAVRSLPGCGARACRRFNRSRHAIGRPGPHGSLRPDSSGRLTCSTSRLSGPSSSRGSILATLFTPHVPYHIEGDIDSGSDHFMRVLESMCPDASRVGQPCRNPDERRRVLPRDAPGDSRRHRNDQHGVLHLQEERNRRPVHRGAVRARACRRPCDARHGRDRQLRSVPKVVETADGRRLPCGRVPAVRMVSTRPAEQPHAPGAAGRRWRHRVRGRRRCGGLVVEAAPRQADVARHDGTHRRTRCRPIFRALSPRTGWNATARS